jgi:hypothetical protein
MNGEGLSAVLTISASRSRRWVLLVAALALPAIASPLLFIPLDLPLSRPVLVAVEAILGHPRWWATAATLVGVLGARQFAVSRFHEGAVVVLVVLAWSLGCDTVAVIDHLF